MGPPAETPLDWIGSSRKDLSKFPEEVRQVAGYALYLAQIGRKHHDAGPVSGVRGGTTRKVKVDHETDTYRVAYEVGLEDTVCVLHAFKKKSSSGIATPQNEIDKIKDRKKLAESLHAEGKLPSQR